jgi:capsular exopolysaccharide synthesis family protein
MSKELVGMPRELVAARQSQYAGTQLQQWQEQPQYGTPNPAKSPLERPLAAIMRYKWLMLVVVVLSSIGGVAATRLLTEQYEVQARIMIMTGNNQGEDRLGPIRSPGLVQPDDWTQLIRSFAIVDPVVRKLSLFLTPKSASDIEVFRGFAVADSFRAGKYQLDIDRAKNQWVLMMAASKFALDSGTAVDSLGRKLGFRWVLPPEAVNGQGVRSVEFTVSTLREAAVQLIERVTPQRTQASNFVRLTFEDRDPERAAEILNEWVRQFVDVAAVLKKRKLIEFSGTLDGQLQTQKQALDEAEEQLEAFRVQTIAQPSEGVPVAAGLQETRDPVFRAFFEKSSEYDEVHRDVQFLRSLIASLARDSVPSEALLQVNTVATGSPASKALQDAVSQYHTVRANLSSQRLMYTDEHPTVKQSIAEMNNLKNDKIPLYARELLTTLRTREKEDSVRVQDMKANLKEIPPRTIEEERLRRKRDAAARLFTDLQARHSEAELAEKSSTPDISVLDWAIAPLHPTKNTKPRLILMAIVGGIGAALALAILLDRIDGRLRYPEQATDDLGLPVAGTVPKFPKGGINHHSTEETYQLVESFRSLRMTVLQAAHGGPVVVAVSSPSPGDGKSLISANLAMSFADAGLRTVLVDGDTRRGALNEMFGFPSAPGLTEYLGGRADLDQVLMPTSHPALSVVVCGTRRRRSPELITSPRLLTLVEALRATHDVVIFDTPPLAAGVDGYAIASATQSLLVVLRIGKTARRLAAEKLRVLDTLPVEVVGAVLNGIQLSGAYAYYEYVPGYEAEDESEETAIVKAT